MTTAPPPLKHDQRDPVDIHVGQRVKVRRMMCGISQKALAAHIHVHEMQMGKYESGANRISAARLWYIAQALRCSPNWFYDDMEMEEGQPAHPELKPRKAFRLDQETWTVVRYYESMPESMRGVVKKFLREMSEVGRKYSRQPQMDKLPEKAKPKDKRESER